MDIYEQQQDFLTQFDTATKRDDWYACPRAARLALHTLRGKSDISRSDVDQAITYAYKREKRHLMEMDRISILDLFDVTVPALSGHSVFRTLFDTLKDDAEIERQRMPGIRLKKQFNNALRRVKNEAYASYHTKGHSPLHKGVTQLFRESLVSLPRDMAQVDQEILVWAVEDAAGNIAPKSPPQRSQHQAAEVMWAVLKAIKPT